MLKSKLALLELEDRAVPAAGLNSLMGSGSLVGTLSLGDNTAAHVSTSADVSGSVTSMTYRGEKAAADATSSGVLTGMIDVSGSLRAMTRLTGEFFGSIKANVDVTDSGVDANYDAGAGVDAAFNAAADASAKADGAASGLVDADSHTTGHATGQVNDYRSADAKLNGSFSAKVS